MRGHCQRSCNLSGPAYSRFCFSYCLSFRSDPVCPQPVKVLAQTDDPNVFAALQEIDEDLTEDVADIMVALLAREQDLTPAPTPGAFVQPAEPLLMAPSNESESIPPVLSISQLAMGYNPFLGLEPHDQFGIYMRHEIFQFHVDFENVFLVAPNPALDVGAVGRFAAPLEYRVTPMLADCSYSSMERGAVTTSRADFMDKTWRSKSTGLADINYSASVSAEVMPGVGAEAGIQTTLNAAVGNSKEAQNGRNYEAGGLTSSVTSRLKRTYYKAGLRLDRFTADSFQADFKADAARLGNKVYNFERTIDFITKYGAYVFDSATMGATLYRSFFFKSDTSLDDIVKATQSEEFKEVNVFASSKSRKGGSAEASTGGTSTVAFSYTDVERVGEFNTGSESQDSTTDTSSCAIGNSIVPQVRWPGSRSTG